LNFSLTVVFSKDYIKKKTSLNIAKG
jgi:hypothetical protein